MNEPKYFITKHYPGRWSSGPEIQTLMPRTYEPIPSLEAAKELAESLKVFSHGNDRCDTTYGVMYAT